MLGSQWSIILGYRRLSVKLLNAKQRLSFLEDVFGHVTARFLDSRIGSTVERTSFPANRCLGQRLPFKPSIFSHLFFNSSNLGNLSMDFSSYFYIYDLLFSLFLRFMLRTVPCFLSYGLFLVYSLLD